MEQVRNDARLYTSVLQEEAQIRNDISTENRKLKNALSALTKLATAVKPMTELNAKLRQDV